MHHIYTISDVTHKNLHEIIGNRNREFAAHELIFALRRLNEGIPKFDSQKSKQRLIQLNKKLNALEAPEINHIVYEACLNDYEEDDHRLEPDFYYDAASDYIKQALLILKKYSTIEFRPPILGTKHELLKNYLPRIMNKPLQKFTTGDLAKDSETAEILACIYHEVADTEGLNTAYKALQRLSDDVKPSQP